MLFCCAMLCVFQCLFFVRHFLLRFCVAVCVRVPLIRPCPLLDCPRSRVLKLTRSCLFCVCDCFEGERDIGTTRNCCVTPLAL